MEEIILKKNIRSLDCPALLPLAYNARVFPCPENKNFLLLSTESTHVTVQQSYSHHQTPS